MSYDKLRRGRGRDSGNTLDMIENNMETNHENAAAVANEIFSSQGGSPQRSLRPREDGTMSYGPITLTETGIIWPDNRQVNEELFEGLGRQLLRLDGSLQWMIGDWLVYGENHLWGKTIKQLAKEYGKEESTIYVYKSVAANVLIRIKGLSFGHHQIVAPLEADEQESWLKEAVDNGWSIAQLRKAIKGDTDEPKTPMELNKSRIAIIVSYGKKNAGDKAALIKLFKAAIEELENSR